MNKELIFLMKMTVIIFSLNNYARGIRKRVCECVLFFNRKVVLLALFQGCTEHYFSESQTFIAILRPFLYTNDNFVADLMHNTPHSK